MKLTILGSGGCVSLPKPTCRCPVCTQARSLGVPYARHGCSLFLQDARLLIDTPEDIIAALNHADVGVVEAIAYSHWDPDHTLGMRVIEQLRMDWLALSVGDFHPTPLRILAMDGVMNDLNALRNPYGSFLDYYERRGLSAREIVSGPLSFGDITLTLVPVDESRRVTVFVLSQHGKTCIYAPCDVKPFPDSPLFHGADVLIIGNTMVGPALKDGMVPSEDNPLRKELFTLDEVIAIQRQYEIGQLVVTHLEEDWGKSYDDYREMEKSLHNVRFAYDGMEVIL